MIVTFNCEWTTPEEECEASCAHGELHGVSAILGTEWRPVCPANDNLPVWLEIYG